MKRPSTPYTYAFIALKILIKHIEYRNCNNRLQLNIIRTYILEMPVLHPETLWDRS